MRDPAAGIRISQSLRVSARLPQFHPVVHQVTFMLNVPRRFPLVASWPPRLGPYLCYRFHAAAWIFARLTARTTTFRFAGRVTLLTVLPEFSVNEYA
jgi:hypothetical protein